MWLLGLIISIVVLMLMGAISVAINNSNYTKKHRFSLFNALFAGVFVAASEHKPHRYIYHRNTYLYNRTA